MDQLYLPNHSVRDFLQLVEKEVDEDNLWLHAAVPDAAPIVSAKLTTMVF